MSMRGNGNSSGPWHKSRSKVIYVGSGMPRP